MDHRQLIDVDIMVIVVVVDIWTASTYRAVVRVLGKLMNIRCDLTIVVVSSSQLYVRWLFALALLRWMLQSLINRLLLVIQRLLTFHLLSCQRKPIDFFTGPQIGFVRYLADGMLPALGANYIAIVCFVDDADYAVTFRAAILAIGAIAWLLYN